MKNFTKKLSILLMVAGIMNLNVSLDAMGVGTGKLPTNTKKHSNFEVASSIQHVKSGYYNRELNQVTLTYNSGREVLIPDIKTTSSTNARIADNDYLGKFFMVNNSIENYDPDQVSGDSVSDSTSSGGYTYLYGKLPKSKN